MVVYFHTATTIFAVANGICSQVMDQDGVVIDDHHLHLHRLLGGVADALTATEVKVDEGSIVPGLRLQFDFRGTTLTTDPVISIENAPSLSIRPQPRSIPPLPRDYGDDAPKTVRATPSSLLPPSRRG